MALPAQTQYMRLNDPTCLGQLRFVIHIPSLCKKEAVILYIVVFIPIDRRNELGLVVRLLLKIEQQLSNEIWIPLHGFPMPMLGLVERGGAAAVTVQ